MTIFEWVLVYYLIGANMCIIWHVVEQKYLTLADLLQSLTFLAAIWPLIAVFGFADWFYNLIKKSSNIYIWRKYR